jgi:hypothetical protein
VTTNRTQKPLEKSANLVYMCMCDCLDHKIKGRKNGKESRRIVNASYIIMIYINIILRQKPDALFTLCLLQYSNVRASCYLPSRHYLRTHYVSDVRQMSLLSSVRHCFCHLWKQFLNYTCAHARKTLIKSSCFKYTQITCYKL